jgi:predicted nucleotidyltransferase/uncharacterized protein (UPF0332 family)
MVIDNSADLEFQESRIKKLKKQKKHPKISIDDVPTLKITTDKEIAMDFAQKVYQKFDKIVKAVVLFGSAQKHTEVAGSDIDIIVIVDDAIIRFDEKLISWYREEIGNIVSLNPYQKELHINTVKLTTWWKDLMRGDPVAINIIRYGDALIDFGGFFNPLKILLEQGLIKPTPEAIYTCLNRVPEHIARSKRAEVSSIEGCFWAMVDAAHALLMSIKLLPPSPEHVPILLKENFVDKGLLKIKYVIWYKDIYDLHRKISHGEINDLKGELIDGWQDRSEEFFKVVVKLIDEIIE